jgi:hypothetical protein
MDSMKRVWLLCLLLLVGCAAKQKPAPPPQPPAPSPIRSQVPPPTAELIEHCVVTKEENANTVSCRCLPVRTKIDSKTGQMVVSVRKCPRRSKKSTKSNFMLSVFWTLFSVQNHAALKYAASEIMFEHHDDPDIARKVQIEAQAFLRRVKEGLI